MDRRKMTKAIKGAERLQFPLTTAQLPSKALGLKPHMMHCKGCRQ